EIVSQAAPEHLHHVRRAGDVNSKVSLVQLMHDALETADEFLRVASLGKHDDIGRLAVVGDQQPAPERTGQCILKTLRPNAQTLDRAYLINRLNLLSQLLDPLQITGG